MTNLILIRLVLAFTLVSVSMAKTCPSIDVRNSVDQLNQIRGCNIIDGSLQIVLMENSNITARDFEEYSFPELTQITDFLMFFRVKKLTSIGKLFPNLAVIRGQNLFQNYALVIFELENLSEIGLYNLTRIFRGSIRIEKNENLCYVETVDWDRILPPNSEVIAVKGNLCNEQRCPDNCKKCWNSDFCQLSHSASCSPPCLYGCNGTLGFCEICTNLLENHRCVNDCSQDRYLLKHLSRCVSKEECLNFNADNWWVFNNTCIKECPPRHDKINNTCQPCDKCHKVCNDSIIRSMNDIKNLKGCTNITGSLQIRLEAGIEGNIDKELEENFRHIEEIGEYLKVIRSFPIRSLNFFRSLRVIKGLKLENNMYALAVFENPNLQELWPHEKTDIEILNGTFSFHFNPKLCPTEIERLSKFSKLKKNYTWVDVSNHSNGDSFACNVVNINVTVLNVTEFSVNLKWTAPPRKEDEPSVTEYLIFYKEADDNDPHTEEASCGVPAWVTLFAFFNDDTQSVFTWNITNLRTYINYTYFVRTNSRFGGRSEIQSVLTLSGEPSVPMNVLAEPENSSAIRLSWDQPTNFNGILSHYIIVGYFQHDNTAFTDFRNYCNIKMIESTEVSLVETTTLVPSLANCVCLDPADNATITVIQKEDFDAICNGLVKITYNASRGMQYHGCASYKYQVIPAQQKYLGDIVEKREETTTIIPDDKVTDQLAPGYFEMIVQPNETSIVLENLKHFTVYMLLIAACNENRTKIPQCSSGVKVSQRTGRKYDADNITDLEIQIVNKNDVEVSWSEPSDPNAVIVSYDVMCRRKDKPHTLPECLTRRQHEKAGFKYLLRQLNPGEYELSVRATSLAGPGNETPVKTFTIILPSQTHPIVALVTALLVLLVLAFVAYMYWYHKIRPFQNMQQLVANVNPEYAEFNEGDPGKILREKVTVKEIIGTGTFGRVLSGTVIINDKEIPCAIKSLNEGASVNDQMEFVHEAAVMRNFTEAHHVIKLIGVVTEIPVMVIMELMERGDLKNYLRNCRGSSANLGYSEICRMAAEIADGMSYLSARKYVHRDLAARNCMVSCDKTVKVGDFGMTRDIYETDYYRKETKGLLPVRWMSPESLADGVFTSDSDNWSYGVVLWEIVTYAEQPYQGMSNEQVLQFVTSGGALSRPKDCSDLIWTIMSQCFNWVPSRRPLFVEIVERIADHVGTDFRLVSFHDSSAGQEFRRTIAEVNASRQDHQPAMLQGRVVAHWSRDDEDEVRFAAAASPSESPTMSLLNNPQSPPRSLPNEYSPSPGTSGLQGT